MRDVDLWTGGKEEETFGDSKGRGRLEALDLAGRSLLSGCGPAPSTGSAGVSRHSSPHRGRPESGAFRGWGRTFCSSSLPGQSRRCLSLGSVSSSAARVRSRFCSVWLGLSGSDGCQGAAVDTGEGRVQGERGPKSSPASPRPRLAPSHPPEGMKPRVLTTQDPRRREAAERNAGRQLSRAPFMIPCFLKKRGPRELLGASDHVGCGMVPSLASGTEASFPGICLTSVIGNVTSSSARLSTENWGIRPTCDCASPHPLSRTPRVALSDVSCR